MNQSSSTDFFTNNVSKRRRVEVSSHIENEYSENVSVIDEEYEIMNDEPNSVENDENAVDDNDDDEEEDEVNIEDDINVIDLSEEIVGLRVVKKTRENYERTYKFITKYCTQYIPEAVNNEGKLIIPITLENLKKFLSAMSQPKANGTVRAKTTIGGYISSLKFFYTEHDTSVGVDTEKYLEKFMSGYKRLVAKKKSTGVMKNFEGKVAVSFQLYIQLCKLSLFVSDIRTNFSAFVHVFMILCWNLFARSITVTELRTNHLSWDNDSLKVEFSKTKADQGGEKSTPKHVFANPFKPEICPILALAIHVFSVTFRNQGPDRTLLFLGSPYDIFGRWLQSALTSITNLGYSIHDFGTHSFRKGIATFSSGFIGGPSVIAIFLRAGWSLGQVQDRYILFSDGGDQLCGRVAAGLNFNDGCNFAVLPPRFTSNDVLTKAEWELICPGYDNHPETFRACLPYLLASLVFHYDWLHKKTLSGQYENISHKHQIFNSRLFTSGILQKLKPHLLGINTSGRCVVTGMTATGIPPHVDLARKLQDLQDENKQLKEYVTLAHAEIMTTLPDMVSNLVHDKLIANFDINGIQQMTKNDVMMCIMEVLKSWDGERNHNSTPQHVDMAPNTDSDIHGYKYWNWKGKFRPVPEDWEFPKVNTKCICDLFMLGVPVEKIRPFRKFKSNDLHRKDQNLYCKAEVVFNSICEFYVSKIQDKPIMVHSVQCIHKLNIVDWDNVFESSFQSICMLIDSKKKGNSMKKSSELSYITFYDYLKYIK